MHKCINMTQNLDNHNINSKYWHNGLFCWGWYGSSVFIFWDWNSVFSFLFFDVTMPSVENSW